MSRIEPSRHETRQVKVNFYFLVNPSEFIKLKLNLFGPVLLGLTDVVRIFPALLGYAEEDPDEAPTLGRPQDEIPMYQITCRNKALEIKL